VLNTSDGEVACSTGGNWNLTSHSDRVRKIRFRKGFSRGTELQRSVKNRTFMSN
jgi:hypothetical protein